jgi:uncharacterized protein (DUF305 family)
LQLGAGIKAKRRRLRERAQSIISGFNKMAPDHCAMEYSLGCGVYITGPLFRLKLETVMRRGNQTYRSAPSSFLVTAALLITAASPALAQQPAVSPVAVKLSAEAGYLQQNTTAMNKMMADMSIKPTGDVDHDFVATMQPHHQGAIDMAQSELTFGHNEQLTRIAQGIIVEQLQEIAAMRVAIGESASPSWVTGPVSAGANAARRGNIAAEASYVSQNNLAMNKMMADMAVAPTGDVDHDFVAMMVPHHQGAIDMSQLELRYGHNAQLQEVAQEIIVDQIQEISMMRIALDETLPGSIVSPTQGLPLAESTDASPAPSTERMAPKLQNMGAMSSAMNMAANATDSK